MKFFKKASDGGPDSGVTGYWLVEGKKTFSIVLLHFSPGSRDAYHSHAFNALTWWLKGRVREVTLIQPYGMRSVPYVTQYSPSIRPKWTPRNRMHKVVADIHGAWAISFRGPWLDTWQERKAGFTYTLTHGRVRV